MNHVLAIDLGTTGVRAIVFGPDARSRGSAYRELDTEFPRPGWVEHNPESIWSATCKVIHEALGGTRLSAERIAAIGIASQRSSIMAWDAATLKPLSPLISWQDVRGTERCRELGEKGFFVTPAMAVSKAEWILREIPESREAAGRDRLRLATADSWLCARLTGGIHVTDHANASATGFYAYLENNWDRGLLEELGIRSSWLPELVDCSGTVGSSTTDVLGACVPVAGICGDQQAALFGLGCTAQGETKCSYGTAAMVDANTGNTVAGGGPGSYPLVAWSIHGSKVYCSEGQVVTAGAAIQWLRDGAGMIEDAAMSAVLAASVPDCAGVWVVPAFQGLGTPFMESSARALIGGLSRGSRKAHIVRAVLEGVAQRVADASESLWEATSKPAVLRVDGGASRNDFLMQRQADLLGIPVQRSRDSDGAALGVAALAARAVGAWDTTALERAWQAERSFEPLISSDERAQLRSSWRRVVAAAARLAVET